MLGCLWLRVRGFGAFRCRLAEYRAKAWVAARARVFDQGRLAEFMQWACFGLARCARGIVAFRCRFAKLSVRAFVIARAGLRGL